MHELNRRAYLESMGIDSYVSRAQLPGSAPTHRLVLVRHSTSAQEPGSGKAQGLAATLAAPEALKTHTAKIAVSAPVVATAQPVEAEALKSTPIPSFSIAAIACGGWLWLEDLSSETVSRDQVQLIRAMARALGLDTQQLDVSQFNWPIHRNTQLDLGEDAARAGLGGFVQRKCDQQNCGGLIFLGSVCQQRLGESQSGPGQRINTVSTSQMLLDPLQKKQAWLDLLPIASRS